MMHGWKMLVTMTVATSAVALSGPSARPSLIWNASASVPIGLYRLQPDPQPKVDEVVVVRPPADLVWFLAEGGYLPRGVPLLKHVAALGGQRICRTGLAVSIDGKHVGDALERDRRGRALPVWQGCVVLSDAQVFLFNADRPDSLDGRYFGPLERSTIVGRASPVWTQGER
jgi:conjugative transfer signal peptidase TraF